MGEARVARVDFEPAVERRIQNRLKRIEGQVRGVQRLIAEHASCDDVLIQVAALKQALSAVAMDVLQSHLDACVAEVAEQGDGTQVLASVKGILARVLRQNA